MGMKQTNSYGKENENAVIEVKMVADIAAN